jgi:hypothetical protein
MRSALSAKLNLVRQTARWPGHHIAELSVFLPKIMHTTFGVPQTAADDVEIPGLPSKDFVVMLPIVKANAKGSL